MMVKRKIGAGSVVLCGLFLSFGSLFDSGLGQETSSSPPAAAPSFQANEVEWKSSKSAQSFPLPVRIIEVPEGSIGSTEHSAQSEKREAENLEVQRDALVVAKRSADAAEKQARVGWWQFFLAAAGTAALLMSLKWSRDALVLAKRSTEAAVDAARAASLAAQAAVKIELPIIRPAFLDELTALSGPVPLDKPYGGVGNDGVPTKHSAVSYARYRNFGRTPAFPIKVEVGLAVADKLPTVPRYGRTISFKQTEIIRPEPEDDPFFVELHFGIDLTDDELRSLSSQSANLWLFSALHYRDFMNNEHIARFCWRWAQRPAGEGMHYFDCDGSPPEAYTICT